MVVNEYVKGDLTMNRAKQRRRSKNNKVSLIFGVIITLLILTVGVALVTNYIQQANEKKLEVQTEINSEIVEKDIKLEHEQKENVLFKSSISYPVTNISSVDDEINKWIESIESNFQEIVDTLDFKKESEQATLNITTDVTKSTDDVFQFLLTADQSIKQEKKQNKQSWMIDLSDSKGVVFSDIFNQDFLVNDDRFKDTFTEATIEQIKNKEAFPFIVDGETLTIHEFNDNTWQTASVNLMDFYEQINENYYDRLLTEDVREEIAAIIAEEERKKAEEQAEQEQNENETPQNPLGDKKYIALTFDDGPHGTVTERVLDTLQQYNARATFFMLGDNAASYPQIAKKVADAGHEIANHSISHPDLAKMSVDNVRDQLMTSKKQITDATGKTPIYFRPPYGSFNDTVLQIAQETNQKVMLWSVDTRDWESRNPAAINQVVQQYSRPGSILLMHDIHATTADALPQMLEYLSSQGYEFVTLSELMPYLEDKGIGPYRGY